MAAITVAAVCEGKVQAAVGRRSGRRVQIRQLGEAQLPEGCLTGSLQVDPAALQSALADFWQDQRLPVRRVTLLLGGRPFVCRRLCLPHMRPGRLRGVLRHEMDTAGEIADPLDDYMLLDRDLRRGTDTVLATRVGGIPDIVTPAHDAGCLVDYGDRAGLAAALEAVMADPAQLARWGANGPRVVAETFSVATQSARMLALYEGRNDPRWN